MREDCPLSGFTGCGKMPVLRRTQPSAAKAELIYTAVMYGLKAVPFRETSFSL
jgi:hypothetical protein